MAEDSWNALNFNLFEELENRDPRVEHFVRSRLRRRPTEVSDDPIQLDPLTRPGPTRIFVSRVPESVLESSLRDILERFGPVANFRRHPYSKFGSPGLSFFHATLPSGSRALAALRFFSDIDLGAGKLDAQLARDPERAGRLRIAEAEAEFAEEQRLKESYLAKLEARRRNCVTDVNEDTLFSTIQRPDSSQRQTMEPTELPMKEKCRVLCHDIDTRNSFIFLSDGTFSVSLVSPSPTRINQIKAMENLVNRETENVTMSPALTPDRVSVGSEVLGLYLGAFYRAIVLESFGSDYRVWFCDYGNVEMLKLSELRIMKDQIRKACPRVAILCKIAGLSFRPGGFQTEELKWMTDLIKSRTIEIEVVGSEDKPNVRISDANFIITDQDTNTSLSLKEELIARKMAFPKTLAYPVKYDDMKSKTFRTTVTFPCDVTAYETPNDFWVEIREDGPDFRQLAAQITDKNCEHSPSANIPPEVQDMVLAKWNDGNFYRGVVTEFSQSLCKVRFVDYGNEGDIKLEHIRPLTPEFVRFEMQALHCVLSGCCPKIVGEWEAESKAVGRELLAQADTCEVRTIVDGMFNVIIRDKLSNSVNQALIERGLAFRESYCAPVAASHRPQRGIVGGQRGGLRRPSSPSPRDSRSLLAPLEPPTSQMNGLSTRELPSPQSTPPSQHHSAEMHTRPPSHVEAGSYPNRSPRDSAFSHRPNVPNGLGPRSDPFNLADAVVEETAMTTPEPPLRSPHQPHPLGGSSGSVEGSAALRRRVEELERIVEAQNHQIVSLEAQLKSRPQTDSHDEERLINLETEIAALKRAHEGLERDLIKKKII